MGMSPWAGTSAERLSQGGTVCGPQNRHPGLQPDLCTASVGLILHRGVVARWREVLVQRKLSLLSRWSFFGAFSEVKFAKRNFFYILEVEEVTFSTFSEHFRVPTASKKLSNVSKVTFWHTFECCSFLGPWFFRRRKYSAKSKKSSRRNFFKGFQKGQKVIYPPPRNFVAAFQKIQKVS